MNILEKRPIVFTAMSKHNFYLKDIISGFVLKNDCVPLNPFMSFGYFLNDMVDRDYIRRANNNMVIISDELWVFGIIADGVIFEIELAINKNMKIRFFTIDGHGVNINEILEIKELIFEDNLNISNDFLKKIDNYIHKKC